MREGGALGRNLGLQVDSVGQHDQPLRVAGVLELVHSRHALERIGQRLVEEALPPRLVGAPDLAEQLVGFRARALARRLDEEVLALGLGLGLGLALALALGLGLGLGSGLGLGLGLPGRARRAPSRPG